MGYAYMLKLECICDKMFMGCYMVCLYHLYMKNCWNDMQEIQNLIGAKWVQNLKTLLNNCWNDMQEIQNLIGAK